MFNKKGFTLIELLVVIAVMAIIASAVLVLIDPADKINAANDSRVQADTGQVGTALVSYAAANGGNYLVGTAWADLNPLTTSGDLTRVPTAPTGYTFGYAGTISSAKVYVNLKSKKYTNSALNYWVWCNTSGGAAAMAGSGSCP